MQSSNSIGTAHPMAPGANAPKPLDQCDGFAGYSTIESCIGPSIPQANPAPVDHRQNHIACPDSEFIQNRTAREFPRM